MTVSKYRTFDNTRFELQFIAVSREAALKSIGERKKTVSFFIRNYRIVPVKTKGLKSYNFKKKIAYAVYGI